MGKFTIFILLVTGCTAGPKVKLSDEQKTRLWSCKDPDLTKVSASTTVTLCNGTDAVGQLVDCSADAQTGCVATSTFKAADISKVDATKIRSGTTIVGVGGSLADCAADGTVGCVTTTTYKSANTSAYSAFDIRSGVTVGGLAGSLAFCKNAADTAFFDNSAAPAAAGLDVWDTIDDYENGGTFPSMNAFSGVSGAVCSASNWQDVTADGACDSGADQCVMKDKITGLQWTAYQASAVWATAITTCNGLTFNNQTGWRLPTQKELMQAYVDGAYVMANPNWITTAEFGADVFWSATTSSTNTAQQIPVSLATGWSPQNGDLTGNSHNVTCVRP